jgi:hypothetical protein
VVDLTAEVDVRPTTKKGKGKAPAQGTTNKEKGKAPVGKSVRGAKNKRKLVVQVEDEESSMMDLPEEVPQRDLSEEEEEEVEKSLPPTPAKEMRDESAKIVNQANDYLARIGVSTARPNRPLIPPRPKAQSHFAFGDETDSDSDTPLARRGTRSSTVGAKLKEQTLKVFPHWDFDRQERCIKVLTNTGTASVEEYDRMVWEKESMPGTRGIESEKNSGGNSSDNGSDWEENSLRKLVSAKLPTLSDKFSSNTDKIVVVSPVPSPRKATLRPPLNVAGVTLLRTPQGKLNKIIPVGTVPYGTVP